MNKKILIGTFLLNTCPNVTEIISKNLDYIIIDREHGPHNFTSTNILNKIIKKNCLSLIRVSHLSKIEIQRCLDLNPDGILIPQISSYEVAKLAISSSFFKPMGDRGLSPYTSAFDYNHNDSDSKKKEINKLIGQIHQEGLTLVPTRLYFQKGKVKIQIAIGKGKKLYDKRQVKKNRDWTREKARIFSNSKK